MLDIKEQVQEEFLRDADVNELVLWLKDNSEHKRLPLRDFWDIDFHGLRKKYEKIWLDKDISKLTTALALYGKDQATLKSIVMNTSQPMHIRITAARNPALLQGFGSSNTLTGQSNLFSTFKPDDVLKLYESGKEGKDLFFQLFGNPGIIEDFLIHIFEKHEPYDVFTDEDLSRIFAISACSETGFFVSNKPSIDQGEYTLETGNLVSSMNKFIPRIISRCTENNVHRWIETIHEFFENTKNIGFQCGVYDDEVFLMLDKENQRLFPDIEEPFNPLLFVKSTLAERAVKPMFDKKKGLEELKASQHEDIHWLYYKHSELSDIYNVKDSFLHTLFSSLSEINQAGSYRLINLDEVINETIPEIIDSFPKSVKVNLLNSIEKIRNSEVNILALIRNENHYKTDGMRLFLKLLCREAHTLGCGHPPPYPESTSTDLYKSIEQSVKNKHPEFFKEPNKFKILERKLTGSIEAIQESVNSGELEADIEDLRLQLSEEKFEYEKNYTELKNKVSEAQQSIKDVKVLIEEQQLERDKANGSMNNTIMYCLGAFAIYAIISFVI